MSKLVTIFGGAGFVGRYVARRMAADGWRVRVATRRPNEALFVRPYGSPGQVEPVMCNIRDEASVTAALLGADAVVNCVGVLNGIGKNSFGAVHDEGAGRIARLAAAAGVQHLVHVSAIGADAEGPSDYAKTKAAGEAAVLSAFAGAVILRPSIIFGPEDQFFNRFATMALIPPMIPLFGANTRFQPVYVDDVAQAAVKAAQGQVAPGVYELGGPEVLTFRELMHKMLGVIQRRRMVVGFPRFVGAAMAFGFDMLQAVTGGLLANKVLTRDQLRSLGRDNVVAEGAKGLADLGISPTTLDQVLPEYLWRFRPSGQYAAIKASAKNLRA
jgi:NADH dehydrogenase